MVGLVVVAVLAIVAGGSAGLWLGLSQTPDGLAAPPPADTFAVSMSAFDDARQVKLDLSTDPGLALVAHTSGVITATSCEPGDTIESGSVPWQVNGAPVLALATKSPFFRDFTADMKGPDVAAVQKELARLGLDVDQTGTFDSDTATAIRQLLARSDIDADTTEGWPLARLVWIPEQEVRIVSCQVVLGGPVADGGPLASTAPSATGVAVSPMPPNLVSGDRMITVGGVSVPVAGDGTISGQAALGKVLGTDLGKAAVETAGSDHPVSLQGTLILADPIDAATVPATAVTSDAGATCVVDPDGNAYAVSVVDSSLGRSVVQFTADTVPNAVQVAPSGGAACT